VQRSTLKNRSLRAVLLLGTASAAAIGFSAQALAQEQTTETVVVTGSRIPQQGLYAPSPVTAVGQQEMKFEGTTGVETLLNNLPAVFASQTSGQSNGSTGTATANLRGLGSVRTLVLVNGTRLAPGDPTNNAGGVAGQNGAADLDQIPAGLVDHVEVLTGGASAVYGSDALAGVVNFVMRKDFEGIEVDGQYGVAQADNTNSSYRAIVASAGDQLAKENIWDGQNTTGTFIMGANTDNGKGNVTAYLSYQNTAAVLAGARDFSACSFSTNSPSTAHVCGGSSNFNRFTSLDLKKSFFQQGTGAPGTGNFVPFVGAQNQLFNYGATNYLQRPDTRYAGGFFAHYEVNKELDVYTSFMFTADDTIAQVAPRGLFLGTGAQGAVGFSLGSFYLINCTNPLLTAQEAATLCPGGGAGNLVPGQASVQIGRRAVEAGPQDREHRHDTYRLQLGARGDLGDGWTYDAYAQYTESVYERLDQGFFSIRNVQNALQVTGTAANPVCISGGSCVPLDIFNGIGSLTPAMVGYVKTPALQQGYTEEQIVSGDLTGDLGKYGIQSPWAKSPVAISIGSEYRAEYLALTPDEEYQTGDLSGAGGSTPPVPRAGFNVVEGFTELKAPLIQEKPFAEDLSFNAGYRYSSYSTAGSVSAYKYGFEYQPIDDFRLRASYERAVRAPNVLELFAPINVTLITSQDPCATSTAGQCASVPNAGNKALLSCPSSQCFQAASGNPSLKPEIGDTRTIGVVFTPTFLDGFTATVDYFNIDVSNEIGTTPPTVTLANCYGASATPASEAQFCPAVHRSTSGQIFGAGYVSAPNVNTGFLHTKGMDFEVNYNLSLDDIAMTAGLGGLQFALVGTWLQEFEINPVKGGTPYSCAGLYGPTCSNNTASGPLPRWRHRLRVTWATPWDVDFSANWRYISSVKLDANTGIPQLKSPSIPTFDPLDATINDFWYLDLAADWNVRSGVDLRAGVNNVFGRLPPAISTFALPTGPGNDNTFPGTYDALGRTMFIGVTIKY
jgi:iron complex outermembrane recepter protein